MPNLHSLHRRLDRLDTGRLIDARRVVTMEREADESVAVAFARWCASHPGEPAPVDDDNTLIFMQTFVDPPNDQRAPSYREARVLAMLENL